MVRRYAFSLLAISYRTERISAVRGLTDALNNASECACPFEMSDIRLDRSTELSLDRAFPGSKSVNIHIKWLFG